MASHTSEVAGPGARSSILTTRVPVTRISEIVNCRRGISADTALRLGRYFVSTPEFWMNLQTAYDLEVAERESKREIERDVHPREVA